jgi:hypothetical protein
MFGPPSAALKLTSAAVDEFFMLVNRTADGVERQDVLELLKKHLAGPAQKYYTPSSSPGWAESDLRSTMEAAADNGPLFVEGFYDACEALRNTGRSAPEPYHINRVLQENASPLRVRPPELVSERGSSDLVPVRDRPRSLDEKAADVLARSIARSNDLLAQGRDREAVSELLWLLETVVTAFKGLETDSGRIEGRYFNRIIQDLGAKAERPARKQALAWMTAMHGFLSAPAGGGVRHGLDLAEGVEINSGEAQLFCNLIRSYLQFLLDEHRRLSAGDD